MQLEDAAKETGEVMYTRANDAQAGTKRRRVADSVASSLGLEAMDEISTHVSLTLALVDGMTHVSVHATHVLHDLMTRMRGAGASQCDSGARRDATGLVREARPVTASAAAPAADPVVASASTLPLFCPLEDHNCTLGRGRGCFSSSQSLGVHLRFAHGTIA